MNGKQSFAPREFLDSLKRDEIRRPIVLFGMVKPAEDDDQYLLFAHGYVCANWTRIPLTSIETVEFLNLAPCKDHTHPLVLLHMKQPETDEGQLFSSLVQATSGRMPGGAERLIRRPGRMPGGAERLIRRPGRMPGGAERLIREPRSFEPRRAFADPDFPWCSTLSETEVDEDGTVWCQDWCWESEGVAQYSRC
jgi:hypothetical protein